MSFICCEHSHKPALVFCIPLHSASVLPGVLLTWSAFSPQPASQMSPVTPCRVMRVTKHLRKGCDRVLRVLSAWLLTHLVSWTGQNALGSLFPQKLKGLTIFTLPAQTGMELISAFPQAYQWIQSRSHEKQLCRNQQSHHLSKHADYSLFSPKGWWLPVCCL